MKAVKKSIAFVLMISLILLSACQLSSSDSAEPTEKNSVFTSELTDALNDVISVNNFKGVACVYYNGEKAFESCTGYADSQNSIMNSTETTFRVGSITKQFTAAGICILCEEGKLNLDDSIDRFFSDYQYGSQITVRNLLNMRSGIPDYVNDAEKGSLKTETALGFEVSESNKADENKQAIEKWILSQELTGKPDTDMEYSNSSYFLLGRMIEIVSEQSYHEFIQEKIIDKIGLKHTGFDDSLLTSEGHVYDSAATEEQVLKEGGAQWVYYPGTALACGDLISSVDDLYIWLEQLRSGNIIRQDMLDLMFENNSFHYGFGFFNIDVMSYHGGNIGLYNSFIGFAQNIDMQVIVMNNYGYNQSDNTPISTLVGRQLGNTVVAHYNN